MRSLTTRTLERYAYISRSDVRNENLMIFVHGFGGDFLTTWGKLPFLLHEEADVTPGFSEWDYLFLGYNTRDVDSLLDIASLISTHWRSATTGTPPYKQSYSHISLVGHSLGTLGIRQFLCGNLLPRGEIGRILHSIHLFGTPLDGSWLAPFAIHATIGAALRAGNPQLRMLHVWTDSIYCHEPWPQVKLMLGHGDRIVGHKYAELLTWTGDDIPSITPLGHSALVKPEDWLHPLLTHLAGALK